MPQYQPPMDDFAPFVSGAAYDRMFAANRANNPNVAEVVRNRFYDSVLYPTAGQQQLSFFVNQVGTGVTTALGATAGTVKTENDTNLQMPNTLPSGAEYLAQSLEVLFFPGSVSTANTYTPQTIAFFNATAALAVMAAANDVNTFYQSGRLEFKVLNKTYLQEQPLAVFPPKAFFDYSGAVASNSATTAEVGAQVCKVSGRPYYLEPAVTLLSACNFSVNLIWPAAVATPSGFNGRVVVAFDGLFKRASQ